MLEERRIRGGRYWAVLLCAAVAWLSPAETRGEYYSWIDPSGTMVLTNDPSNIPPASKRSRVVIHHYQDSSAQDNPVSAAQSAPAPARPQAPSAINPAAAVNSVDPDLPKVLLDVPDPSVRSQYNWVPLASPMSLNSGTVAGFWCLRAVTSPLQAFRQYLQDVGWSGQGSQMMAAGQSPWLYGYGRHYRRVWGANQRWGTQGYGIPGSVYNQTLGEIRGMQAQAGAQFGSSDPVYNQTLSQIQGMQAQVGEQFRSNDPVYNQTISQIQGMQAQVGAQFRSGHPVYDQVMMERQAMNQQLSARLGAGMQAYPSCCAGGFGHAGGGHR